jgi:hypothetical protein
MFSISNAMWFSDDIGVGESDMMLLAALTKVIALVRSETLKPSTHRESPLTATSMALMTACGSESACRDPPACRHLLLNEAIGLRPVPGR